jgi:hypothetical protein
LYIEQLQWCDSKHDHRQYVQCSVCTVCARQIWCMVESMAHDRWHELVIKEAVEAPAPSPVRESKTSYPIASIASGTCRSLLQYQCNHEIDNHCVSEQSLTCVAVKPLMLASHSGHTSSTRSQWALALIFERLATGIQCRKQPDDAWTFNLSKAAQ